jgi:hypothetical protein
MLQDIPLEMRTGGGKLPSFVHKLTLRLSVPPEGVKEEVRPDKMSPESAAKLREHVSSPTLWSLSVNVDDSNPDSIWCWTLPSSDGEFRCLYVRGVDNRVVWIDLGQDTLPDCIPELMDDPDWLPVTRGFGALWYSRPMSSLS